MILFLLFETLTGESDTGAFSARHVTLLRIMQLEKTSSPIVTKDLGNVIVFRLTQYLKALFPILLTLFPMVIEERDLQTSYLEVIDSQLFAVNTVEKWIGCYLWV